MAAAALGNTISDVCGIGSAIYVEKAVYKIGMKPAPLTPVQLDMPVTRRSANLVLISSYLSFIFIIEQNKK